MFRREELKVTKVTWPKKETERVVIDCGACGWAGAKEKDFWRSHDWRKILKKGTIVTYWTIQGSSVVGLQVQQNGDWLDAWCVANDFQTKEESKKSEKAYTDFIEKEGKKIAKLINQGKTLKQIDKLISNDHSGNTHACALTIGISKATNKENAEKVRQEHNEFWGGDKKKKGLINPAILTLDTKEEE